MDAIKLYLKDIKDFPLLSYEEEVALAKRIQKRDPDARKRLIQCNLRLVINLAKRYSRLGVSLLDLIEEGNLGLIKAVSKYDYKMGFRFSTYAAWWIKQYVMRAVSNQSKTVRIPVYMIETIMKWRKITEHLMHELGRKPSRKMVANKMKLSVHKVRKIEGLVIRTSSLDAPITGGDGAGEFINLIEDKNNSLPSWPTAEVMQHDRIIEILEKMPKRENEVLSLRYGLQDGVSRTLGDTAKIFGITRERVRQIEIKAMKKLKEYFKESKDEFVYR